MKQTAEEQATEVLGRQKSTESIKSTFKKTEVKHQIFKMEAMVSWEGNCIQSTPHCMMDDTKGHELRPTLPAKDDAIATTKLNLTQYTFKNILNITLICIGKCVCFCVCADVEVG